MIVKVSGKDIGLIADSRFKKWGKTVRSVADVDLTKTNGYALVSPFVSWGSQVVMQPGQFLVLAAEVGTQAHHDYKYALCRVTESGLERVDDEALVAMKANVDIPEEYRAKAMASPLYAYALYCAYALKGQGAEQGAEEPGLSAEETELVVRINQLSPERRQAVLAAVK